MGTTLTAAKVTGDEVSLGHVGDSRAYRLRDGELEQLTRDHSLVAELERSGQITPEAAEHHPQRSIITRALGPGAGRPGGHLHARRPRRRPLPDLLRRPDEHDLGRRARLDPALRGDASTRPPSRSCAPPTRAAARTTSRSSCSASATATAATSRTVGPARGGRDDRRAAPATTCTRRSRPPRWPRRADGGRSPTPPRRDHRARRREPAAAAPRRRGGAAAAHGARKTLLAAGRARRHRHGACTAVSRQVYFIGTNDAGLVTALPGHPVRAAVRNRPLRAGLRERRARAALSRARGASGCSTTSGAAATTRRTCCARSSAGSCPGLMSARTRELFGLIPVSLLVAAGFAAVLSTRSEDVSDATLTYGAVFLGLCVVAHLFIRARLPDADPYLFPLAALLAAVGLVADLPDRPRVRARAGAVVRGRARVLLRDDPGDPRPPRAGALPLHDRGGRDRAARCCRGCRASASR